MLPLKVGGTFLEEIQSTALISADKVLTAAHCVWDKANPEMILASDVIIKLGAHDLSDTNEPNTISRTPKQIIVHYGWDYAAKKFNDDGRLSNACIIKQPWNFLCRITSCSSLFWFVASSFHISMTLCLTSHYRR